MATAILVSANYIARKRSEIFLGRIWQTAFLRTNRSVPRAALIVKTYCLSVEVQSQSLVGESIVMREPCAIPFIDSVALPRIKQPEYMPSTHALRFHLGNDH